MKKFCLFVLCLLTPFLVACENTPNYLENVVELRTNLFEGESASYKIRASYGRVNDIYKLAFRLIDNYNNDITYTLSFTHQEKDYNLTFLINPIKHALTAETEIENFDDNSFTVKIKVGSDVEEVSLRSIVPENTISAIDALLSVKQNQSALWDNYLDNNGNFTAEIIERIIVKNGKPFWYVGFINSDKTLKALLVDGFTGEILAMRNVI